jgi:hypothetical protein
METFNVELKLTVAEAQTLSRILEFKVGVEQNLVDQYTKRLAEADDGHGNPKELLANLINEGRGEQKKISYLLGVINSATKDAQERTSEPF